MTSTGGSMILTGVSQDLQGRGSGWQRLVGVSPCHEAESTRARVTNRAEHSLSEVGAPCNSCANVSQFYDWSQQGKWMS